MRSIISKLYNISWLLTMSQKKIQNRIVHPNKVHQTGEIGEIHFWGGMENLKNDGKYFYVAF